MRGSSDAITRITFPDLSLLFDARSSFFNFVSFISDDLIAKLECNLSKGAMSFFQSPRVVQLVERDQARQVVAKYIPSGSNGRVDVIVRFDSCL